MSVADVEAKFVEARKHLAEVEGHAQPAIDEIQKLFDEARPEALNMVIRHAMELVLENRRQRMCPGAYVGGRKAPAVE